MASRSTNQTGGGGGGGGGGGPRPPINPTTTSIGRLSSPPAGINESTNQAIKSAVIDEHNPFLSASFPIDAPPSRPPNPPPPQSGDIDNNNININNSNTINDNRIDEDIHRFEGESMQGTHRSKHIGRQSTPPASMEELSSPISSASFASSSMPSPTEEGGKSRLRSFSDDSIDRLKSLFYSPHTSSIINTSRLMASKTLSITKNTAGIIAAHPITQSHLVSAKKMIQEYKQSVPIYYQLLTVFLLITHVGWPLLYFWSAYEARTVIFCSFLHLFISHLLYYQYQRLTCTTIALPALLWLLPALFLFIRPGVGEELSVELAIALHNAHVSPRHVLGLYEVFSSRWYSFLLWYRFALITTSALLPFVILHNIKHYSYHLEDLQNINNGFATDARMAKQEDQSSASASALASTEEEDYSSTPAASAPSASASASAAAAPVPDEQNQSELVKHQRKPTVSVSSIRGPFQSPLAAPANRSNKEKQFFSGSDINAPSNLELNQQEKSGAGTGGTESKGTDRQIKKEMIDQSAVDSKGEKPSGAVGLKPNKPSDTLNESANIGAQHGDATAIKKEDTVKEKMAGPAPSIRTEKTN